MVGTELGNVSVCHIETGKWVSKTVVDNEREEHNKAVDAEIETQMTAAESAVAEMFIDDDDEADLPF